MRGAPTGACTRAFSACADARAWADRESGTPRITSTAITSGRTPPYANMPRQPQLAASSGVIKPADDAPIAKPLAASVVIDTRLVAGASSAQMPIVTGTVAPRPQPASRRHSVSSNGLEDI